MSDDFEKMILAAHKRSFKRALEVAVRTKTALVFMEDNKVVEIKPPYRYQLVPIKSASKKRPKMSRSKK